MTKAEALAVALDHAEETGEYPAELRQRVAALLPQLGLVPPWKLSPWGENTWRRGHHAEVYRHSGAWTARVDPGVPGFPPKTARRQYLDRAQEWCDQQLLMASLFLG